ncbi:hypothetical protein [Sulfurimonas sp.]|uniref:hypothetical protein n=1 Tax=Sulfurimonas sp. TaxID=2022749 RepID=UPI002624A8B9|nr:hypothetical protein [Sulfurimonas sp.]
MKQLIKLILTIVMLFMTACSAPKVTDSSHKSDKKSGFLQEHLDNWLQKDWNPAVKEKDKETSERFKLQDYVDKASLYMKAHPSDYNNSNVKKLEALPVIGIGK